MDRRKIFLFLSSRGAKLEQSCNPEIKIESIFTGNNRFFGRNVSRKIVHTVERDKRTRKKVGSIQ